MTETIRILIADDHEIVRVGLRNVILSEPGMQVIGEAADGEQAVQQARALNPDVILLDLLMPRKDGLTAIAEIRKANPHARILVLTSFAGDDKIFPALQAGAQGYLLKESSSEELLQSIRQVYQGQSPLHPEVSRRVIRKLNQPAESPQKSILTDRELEILKEIARGRSNEEIAEQLVVSESTVRNHITSILAKLNLANRTQATLYALREGIIGMDDV
ncbi:MAG: response regulator transcription factor [Chloroflexota bacterium]|nr:response regulator transcription factor [Chloroflexota bacterium]